MGKVFSQLFIPFLILAFVFVYELLNKNIESKKRHIFYAILIGCLISAIFTYIDYHISSLEEEGIPYIGLRVFSSIVGYVMPPILLMIATYFFYDLKWKELIVLSIPACVNLGLVVSAPLTGFVFIIDEENVWSAGMFHDYTIAVDIFYMAIFVLYFFIYWKRFDKLERISIIFIMSILIIAFLIDLISDSERVIYIAIPVVFLIYYFLLYSSNKRNIISNQSETIEKQKNELLISQIQPHFIYNTLNTIYALTNTDIETAQETILNFSEYLREILGVSNDGTETVPVEKEMEIINHYIQIEEKRFPNIQFDVKVEDGEYTIPVLSIQPMVENAIRHGVRTKKDGKITVHLYKEDKKHIIVIQDNGVGMDAAKLLDLKEGNGIGINNVRSRIERISKGRFTIESSSEGTCIRMEIPQ